MVPQNVEFSWNLLFLSLLIRVKVPAITGTIFEGFRTPLRLWLYAIWDLTSQKYGAKAPRWQRVLGLGSFFTF